MVALSTSFLDWSVDGPVDAVKPRVTAASALSSTTVAISFNEKMLDNAALRDIANYAIDDARVEIFAANPFGDYQVQLIVSEMLDAQAYRVTASNVSDLNGNAVDTAANFADFFGVGSLPELVSVDVLGEKKIRLTFNEPMKRDSDLLSVSSYAVIPLGTGTPVNVGSVVTENKTSPTFVDLDITEMTDGASYQVIVVNVSDTAGNVIGSANTLNFTGKGAPPKILRVEAISKNRVDVVFDEPILDNAFARDKANYVWSGGLVTQAVLDVSGDRIKLVVTDQTPGTLYNLVVG